MVKNAFQMKQKVNHPNFCLYHPISGKKGRELVSEFKTQIQNELKENKWVPEKVRSQIGVGGGLNRNATMNSISCFSIDILMRIHNFEKRKNSGTGYISALSAKKLRINSLGRSFGLFSLLMCILQPELAEVLKFSIKTD